MNTSLTPDWSREHKRLLEWHPSKSLMASIRAFQSARGPLKPLIKALALVRHRFWSAVTASDIPIITRIGGGLVLRHPAGVVVHKNAVIGANVLILSGAVIGQDFDGGVPTIGDGVYIGSGAKIFGAISVGDGARIGANAVVTQDVPANTTAVGVPAEVIEPRTPEQVLMQTDNGPAMDASMGREGAMTRHVVETLDGALLDAAVAKALGARTHSSSDKLWHFPEQHMSCPKADYSPSRSWDQAGPIIARELEDVANNGASGLWKRGAIWKCQLKRSGWVCEGATPLVAAMRTFVATRFGEEVELP